MILSCNWGILLQSFFLISNFTWRMFRSWRRSTPSNEPSNETRSNQCTNAQHTATANLHAVFPHDIEDLDILSYRNSFHSSMMGSEGVRLPVGIQASVLSIGGSRLAYQGKGGAGMPSPHGHYSIVPSRLFHLTIPFHIHINIIISIICCPHQLP